MNSGGSGGGGGGGGDGVGGFGLGIGVGVAGGPSLAAAQQGQGVAALLVMLAVLCFIFAYCCWGAPFCRSLCRRHCCCRLEDPEPESRFGSSDQTMVATPTIILLPHGRMLVVDRTIFTQFQADTTGLDLVELGESVIRAQRNPRTVTRHQLQSSQGSILDMDAETPSKDSLGSIGCFPPPTYESIYGKEEGDMPPSYSDILLHRFANLPYEIEMQEFCQDGKEDVEMRSLESCPHIISNPINPLNYPYATITSLSGQSLARQSLARRHSVISNPLDDYYVDNELEGYGIGRLEAFRPPSGRSILRSHNNLSRASTNSNECVNREVPDNRHPEDITLTTFRASQEHLQEESQRTNEEGQRIGQTARSRIRRIENETMNTRNRIGSPSCSRREVDPDHVDRALQGPGGAETSNVESGSSITPRRVAERLHSGNANRGTEGENNEAGYRNVRFRISLVTEDQLDGNPGVSGDHAEGGNAYEIQRNSTSESVNMEDDSRNFGALADIRESRV
ncbi:uncharacterized protein LOC105697381 [Orussus abietinus]|uniref:uncharacterized protein LOC105697381 n=1 Tax=Orussus abietinus TaxID=222816 RepID=UPI000C7162CA|nr:uncharacterized protein LOC105697381 [Orussus abietinus]